MSLANSRVLYETEELCDVYFYPSYLSSNKVRFRFSRKPKSGPKTVSLSLTPPGWHANMLATGLESRQYMFKMGSRSNEKSRYQIENLLIGRLYF